MFFIQAVSCTFLNPKAVSNSSYDVCTRIYHTCGKIESKILVLFQFKLTQYSFSNTYCNKTGILLKRQSRKLKQRQLTCTRNKHTIKTCGGIRTNVWLLPFRERCKSLITLYEVLWFYARSPSSFHNLNSQESCSSILTRCHFYKLIY